MKTMYPPTPTVIATMACNHESNVPSQLLPQWLCGNSCIWAHDVRLHIAGTNEPKSAQQSHCGDDREGTLFS